MLPVSPSPPLQVGTSPAGEVPGSDHARVRQASSGRQATQVLRGDRVRDGLLPSRLRSSSRQDAGRAWARAPCVRQDAGDPGLSRVPLASWGLGWAELPPAGKQGLRRPLSPARGTRPSRTGPQPCSSSRPNARSPRRHLPLGNLHEEGPSSPGAGPRFNGSRVVLQA